ncbi:GntR family transcriptional regulator [Pseudaestuariivita sp.]|uniref:GntR family transcriptional regulator n=1 Tax=Pseudaestuariivita sp. TaxID=2211669 RepID=UPI004057CC17
MAEPAVAEARRSLTGDAYAQLKAQILSNALAAGASYTEPEIAERLQMSRTPVREALIRLQSEGLLDLIPRRGARIAPLKVQDMREIYEILTALEPHAVAEIAARRPEAEDLAPLKAATEAMEAALTARDLDAWAAADDVFHRALLRLHGNARLCAITSTLFDRSHRARMMTLRLRDLPHKSTAEHRDILGALRRGEAERARQLFRAHRERSAKELLTLLDQLGLPQF